MKYIKRILIILFLVVMISGCSVEYNLKINKDLSVNEKITASENTNRMKSRTNLDVKQSVKYLYKIFKTDSMADDNYSISGSSDITTVVVNNSYDSLDEYISKFDNQDFEVGIDEDDNGDKIFSISQYELINANESTRSVYDDVKVTIEIPFEVSKHNAEKVNGNKYTWTISKNDEDYAYMYVRFNEKKEKNAVSFGFGDSIIHFRYAYIFIGIIIIVLTIILIVLYKKNRQNNKM